MDEQSQSKLVPDLHDGTLNSISCVDGSLVVKCISVIEESYDIHFNNVTRLNATNFREGNIIFEITVHTRDVPVALLKKVYGEEREGEPVWLIDVRGEIAVGELSLLEISSSYGCELLALGRGPISFRKRT
jgi:hypothetical protein